MREKGLEGPQGMREVVVEPLPALLGVVVGHHVMGEVAMGVLLLDR